MKMTQGAEHFQFFEPHPLGPSSVWADITLYDLWVLKCHQCRLKPLPRVAIFGRHHRKWPLSALTRRFVTESKAQSGLMIL